MRALPGYYYDEERKRYFPESSRPKNPPESKPILAEPSRLKSHPSTYQRWLGRVARDHKNIHAKIIQRQRISTRLDMDRVTCSHYSEQISSSSSPTTVRVQNMSLSPYTALQVSESGDEKPAIYLGNRAGQCFASTHDLISPELHLTSEVSTITVSEEIAVYTSFGPYPQVLVRDGRSQEAYVLRPKQLQDVRTSQIHGYSITFGMQKQALHIRDLREPRDFIPLPTGSDVFAIHQEDNEIWAGARNGCVTLFDLRTQRHHRVLAPTTQDYGKAASITHLNKIGEFQMLVAMINGVMEMFDMRMLRRINSSTQPQEAFKVFTGHVNSYSTNLGLAIDPSQDFIFAAGEDNRIRGWSIRTGELLKQPSQIDESALLARYFPNPVLCMKITSNGYRDRLWFTRGHELEYYDLGQRGAERHDDGDFWR